jgi:hypothetical protein
MTKNQKCMGLVLLGVVGGLLFGFVLAAGPLPIFKTQEQRIKEAREKARAEMAPLIEDYKYHSRKADEYSATCKRLSTDDNPACGEEEQ